jgi:hypothetical protein
MGMDVASLWAWRQNLPWWTIFAVVAGVILLAEFAINWWDGKRIRSYQRNRDEYNQSVSDYHEHYKAAQDAVDRVPPVGRPCSRNLTADESGTLLLGSASSPRSPASTVVTDIQVTG